MKLVALLAVLAVTPGCQSIDALEPIEPRARDPLPTQVLKGIAYVPSVVVIGTAVVAAGVLGGIAQDRAEEVAIDEELGRPESTIRRQIY